MAHKVHNETRHMATGPMKSNFTKNLNPINLAPTVKNLFTNGKEEVRTESKPCKSSWKLNGETYHFCTKFAVKGKCLCAVEIEPKTRELTHWKICETHVCLN